MYQLRKLGLIANLILLFVLQTLCADKYTDENRPYEFGFKIDGEQHRHESKDKDGIIMGEFGFVTADDVYHVTVYATDKEGRFKVLSMKNIHLKSTSASEFEVPTSTSRQGHALALPPTPAASVKVIAVTQEPLKQVGVSKQPRLGPFTPQAGPVSQNALAPQPEKPSKSVSFEPPANSCSSCSLPTTTTRAPPPTFNKVTDNNNYISQKQIGAPGSGSQIQGAIPLTAGQQNNVQGGPIISSYSPQEGQQKHSTVQQKVPQRELVAPNGAQSFAPQQGPAEQNNPASASYFPGPGVSNSLNKEQSGSSYNVPGGQQNYPSSQQNIPQGDTVAPDGAQSFASIPGQIPQNNPGSPNYSQGPGISSAPNIAQSKLSGASHSAQGGQQNYPSSQQNIPQGEIIVPDGAQSLTPQPGQIPQNNPGSPIYSQKPGISSAPNNAQGGPIVSSHSAQGGQQNNPSSRQNIPQGEIVAPAGAQSFAPQTGQIPQNYPGSPSYSPGPSIPSSLNNVQGGPIGSSYSPQGGQQKYPSSQQNIPQGLGTPGSAPSFAPQPGQIQQNNPGSPNYSQGLGISNAPNKAQSKPSGASHSTQGVQQNYPSGQKNIPQGEIIVPDDAQSLAPQPAQMPKNNPGSPNYSQGPGIPNAPNKAQGGPSGSSYSPQGGQQKYPSSQQNIPQKGLVSPGSAQSFAPQPGQIQQNNPGSPNYSQEPGILNAPNKAQSKPSGASHSTQGVQQNYPSGQKNIPQGEIIVPDDAQSLAPQPAQMPKNNPGSPNYSQGPGIPNVPNKAQGGASGSSYSPQGGQQKYPSIQQNIPQKGLVSPGSVQSFASQPGQIQKNNPGSPNYSQEPGISNAPNKAQSKPSGASHSTQGDQQNYPSIQQNIPQGEIVAPGGVLPFVPIADRTSQNNPGSPSYSLGPGILNAPNNYSQSGGAVGQQAALLPTNSGEQNRLFDSNNNIRARPSDSASSVPDAGNFGQNNDKQAGLSGPIKSQSTGKSSHPQGAAGERTSKQYNPNLGPNGSQGPTATVSAGSGSAKPMLYTAQMQIVDKNTDIYALGPNEQEGLPPGLSLGDMTQLLYTFNYTVGFHGHFEEGYANGAKQGYYYVTGRNGVRTRIDYVADDTGFHPKISQEVLDLLSEEVPKPETEKDEKYGLKGYEFKWLYYPVEPK